MQEFYLPWAWIGLVHAVTAAMSSNLEKKITKLQQLLIEHYTALEDKKVLKDKSPCEKLKE